MNRNDAKQCLLIYRPGTRDADDPEIAAALRLLEKDPELSRWFEEHCARQNALRQKFQQLPVPAGLKEQIISEHAAAAKAVSWRQKIVGVVAAAAVVLLLGILAFVLLPPAKPRPVPNTLANYLSQMADDALHSSSLNVMTNSAQINSYLARNQAPADYVLPAGLRKFAIRGCAVEPWQNFRASMICFRTGISLPPGQQGDLWLFVIDSADVQGASAITGPQYAQVDGLTTATWTRNGKLYVLDTKRDKKTIQKFL